MHTISQLKEEFGYPDAIGDHLEAIIKPLDSQHIRSLILTGSTSRGELSYRTQNGSLDLFSDYEFLLIVADDADPNYLDGLTDYWHNLEESWGQKSPLFHIDSAPITVERLKNLPQFIRTFETKATGKVLFGEDLRHVIPDVTLDQLDYGELNEILLWRLWSATLYFPLSLLKEQATQTDAELFQFVLHRNSLDLTTWGMPYEKVLLPSFGQRIDHINANFQSLPLAQFIDSEWAEWLTHSLDTKRNINFHYPLPAVYSRFLSQFERALSFVTNQKKVVEDSAEQIVEKLICCSHRHFSDLNIRRKGYEVLVLGRQTRNPINFVKWLGRPKYGLFIACLYALHKAAFSFIQGDEPDAQKWLTLVQSNHQNLFINTPPPLSKTAGLFVEQWQLLRRQLAEFLMGYIRSIENQRPHITARLSA